MRGPTLRQLQLLEWIARGVARGRPYTHRELCELMLFGPVSHGAIADHIRSMEKNGLLHRSPLSIDQRKPTSRPQQRSTRITEKGWYALGAYLNRSGRLGQYRMVERCACGTVMTVAWPCPMCALDTQRQCVTT